MLSPDTIVPDPKNPQSLNRYSYALNNPIGNRDPSGHATCNSADGACQPEPTAPVQSSSSPFINFTGDWTSDERGIVNSAARAIGNRIADSVNLMRRLDSKTLLSAASAFLGVFDGPITFHKTSTKCTVTAGCLAWLAGDRQINVFSISRVNHAVHEIFHILDLQVLGGGPTQALRDAWDANPNFPRRPDGLTEYSRIRSGFASGVIDTYQKSYSNHAAEEFADMGIGWTYNQWEMNAAGTGWSGDGRARANFMNKMTDWLAVKLD